MYILHKHIEVHYTFNILHVECRALALIAPSIAVVGAIHEYILYF